MQIFIRESTEKEWYILDLQGHLEYSGELKNETLGTLTKKPNTKDDFTLQIGNSVLTGKEVPLKKPLLVIRKKKINEELDSDQNEDINMVDSNSELNKDIEESEVEYVIEGMANSKITFTTRPTTIIPQSSVVYGSPTHRVSPTNSPTNAANNSTTVSPTASPIKQPEFNINQ